MNPEVGALGALAESVADGSPVDWSGVEAVAKADDRRLIRHLRLVESIASIYRSIPDLDEIAADEVPDGPRWGRLVLLDLIGRGTSCDVHRAFDTDLHRYVALKLLHEHGGGRAAHERILQEARRLARIRDPHVVQVFGAERHSGRVGLWTELVEGDSLDRIVQTRGRLGPREAAGIGQDICLALAAVHGASLLHRDVKAQNVLREQSGRIVLMDFGTGEELRRDAGSARLVGTPLYLAPEILQGSPASVSSDLYSLGVLLFYLVTGKFPIAAATMEQLKAAHGARQVRRLRDLRADLPARFISVVERALEADPARRYQSAGAMEAALRDYPAIPGPPPVVSVTVTLTRRTATIGTTAALLILIAGLIVWLRFAHPEPPLTPAFTRVAVLPFKDLSETPTPYLAAALTDQLIATLGQVNAFRVTAPRLAGSGSAVPSEEMARRLGVDAIVEGTVTAAPARPNEPVRARVESRIVRAGVATPFWTGSLVWVAGDTRALQAGLVRAIAKAVNLVLAPGDSGRLAAAAPTNPNADDAYNQGYAALAGYGPAAAQRALDLFKRALSFDPRYAAAYAGESRAYVILGQFGVISEGQARQLALGAARKALELNDDLPEAHRALADLSFFYDWDWATAEREYLKTLELNPSFLRARLTYAELLAVLHRFPDALEQSTIARSLDPGSSEVGTAGPVVLYYAGRYPEAQDAIERTLRAQPSLAGAWITRAGIEIAQGRYEDALVSIRRSSERADGGVAVEVTRLHALARAGRTAESRAGLAALEASAASGSIRLSHRDRAFVKVALGDESGACDELEKSFAQRESALRWISVDPRLNPLRGNPRFQAIVDGMSLPLP